MKEYKINVTAGTKVLADMVETVKDATYDATTEIKPVPPGPLPDITAGGVEKRMDVGSGIWTWKGVVLKNPEGGDGIPEGYTGALWFDKVNWSISKMQALPIISVANDFGDSTTKAISQAKATEIRDSQTAIDNLLREGAVMLGSVNVDFTPTPAQLTKSFFVLAYHAGVYSNLGSAEVFDREYAIIHYQIDSLGNQNWFKYLIKSKYELINTDGYLYRGIASPSSTPGLSQLFIPQFFSARVAGTYTNYGGLVVNQDEYAFLQYTPISDIAGNWAKITIAKRGDIICAAHNASQYWKDVADAQAVEATGIGMLNNALGLVKSGGRLILSDGEFKMTNPSDETKFNLNKSVEVVGQGLITVVNTNGDSLDIRVDVDNVNAIVRNISVTHGVGLHRKSNYEWFNSNIEQHDIFVGGQRIDTDAPNYIFKEKSVTLKANDTPAPFKYYAHFGSSSSTANLSYVTSVFTDVLPAWNGNNLKQRRVILMPGTYLDNTVGLMLRTDRGNWLKGLPNYEDQVKIQNDGGTYLEPDDIYFNSAIVGTTLPQIIEGINFKRLLNTKYNKNIIVRNCFRNGVKINDFDSNSRVIEVGKTKLYDGLYNAVRSLANITSQSDRWQIHVFGETRERAQIPAYIPGVDITGHQAKCILIGLDFSSGSQDGLTTTASFDLAFDGLMKGVEFVRAGVLVGYNTPSVIIKSKKGEFKDWKSTNLVMPGKRTTTMVCVDIDGRVLNYTSNADTTFTETEYSRFNSVIIGTRITSFSKPHTHYLPEAKPESEIAKNDWDDFFGGRLYGTLFETPSDSEVKVYNLISKGSPWGLHNTRGFYVNIGKVRIYDSIGIGGGIGHRNFGFVNHRSTTAELYNCIGIGSPFAYLTPMDVAVRTMHNGIKFQFGSSSKMIGCVGYGADMPDSHGIAIDGKANPNIANCVGYKGGGDDSAGLYLYQWGSVDLNGSFYGDNFKNTLHWYTKNSGNGMKIYPYKRPVRYGATLEDVLYKDHWEETIPNEMQRYRFIDINFLRGNNVVSSGLGGVAYVCVYKTNGTVKTLIDKMLLENANGNYQYMSFSNGAVDINSGEWLYLSFENASGVEFSNAPNNIVAMEIVSTEIGERQSAVNIDSYQSRGGEIDVLNGYPTINMLAKATLSNATFKSQNSVRIGEQADIKGTYNIVNCTLDGEITKDVESDVPVRKYNCVQIIDGEVQ